ncbi:Ldh family oxidoreductase [Vibrio ziniensis]|uniref:Ldh family oxidoreductase n=1 Tax=Vibrio ziniensis TaxID=2711221 RepID=A0A6G7CJ50_9VIBR|nr:Ldh family oxidoreductase [Vibrio ziniensis]QIH42076.1 Ldh family oxidoreductase [Vibrio ziniensis]
MDAQQKISIEELRKLCRDVLAHYGFSQLHINALTETLVTGQINECASHGVYRLLGLIHTLNAGKVSPDAHPIVFDHAPAIVKVDAQKTFSPIAFQAGLPLLTEKAKINGLAAMAINHCVHFSALWFEIEQITQQGLVAIACNPSHAWVAPVGGSKSILGTNPFAFGWPRPDNDPFIFDFATSAIARGDIELHRRTNTPLKEGWAVDVKGNPTTDPNEALTGSMLPFGSHKGSALSIMIELIAASLIGDLNSAESLAWDEKAGGLPYHGEIIIAFNPQSFLGDQMSEYFNRAELMFGDIEASGARLPSQRRYAAKKKNLASGMVSIDQTLLKDIQNLLS